MIYNKELLNMMFTGRLEKICDLYRPQPTKPCTGYTTCLTGENRKIEYHSNGRIKKIVDGERYIIKEYKYDKKGRLKKISDCNSYKLNKYKGGTDLLSYQYLHYRNKGLDICQIYEYDGRNREKKVSRYALPGITYPNEKIETLLKTAILTDVTEIKYDKHNRIKSINDIMYEYDYLGDLTRIIKSNGDIIYIKFSNDDDIEILMNRRGDISVLFKYKYDYKNNRILSMDNYSGSGDFFGHVEFVYDDEDNSRLSKIIRNNTESWSYTYNLQGHIMSETYIRNSIVHSNTVYVIPNVFVY